MSVLAAVATLTLTGACSKKGSTVQTPPAAATSKQAVVDPKQAPTPSAAPALVTPRSINDIEWLVGRWVANTKEDGCFFEHWLAPAGASMLGTGGYVPVGGKNYQEGMRFLAGDKGLTYIVTPDGRVVTFVAEPSSPGSIRLTADNEFPAVITYTRKGPDSYHVRLAAKGDVETLEFTFVRVAAGIDCTNIATQAP